MARKDKVRSAYDTILQGSSEKGKKKTEKKPNPVGVALDADEIERLDQIANEIGVSRHGLLQYAVRELIANYERGVRPKTETEKVIRLKPGG